MMMMMDCKHNAIRMTKNNGSLLQCYVENEMENADGDPETRKMKGMQFLEQEEKTAGLDSGSADRSRYAKRSECVGDEVKVGEDVQVDRQGRRSGMV